MALLDTIPQNTAGYDSIINDNMEELNDRIGSALTATKKLGEDAVTDANAATAATLSSGAGTPGSGTSNVTASFDQTILNNNFATLVDQINKLIADNLSLRTQLNLLLAKLRKTGGNGIISD